MSLKAPLKNSVRDKIFLKEIMSNTNLDKYY